MLQHWIAAEAAALPTLAVVFAIASGNEGHETSCDLKWLSKDFHEWYDRLLSRDLWNDLLKFHWDSCCMALGAEELATAWICLSPCLTGWKLTDKLEKTRLKTRTNAKRSASKNSNKKTEKLQCIM